MNQGGVVSPSKPQSWLPAWFWKALLIYLIVAYPLTQWVKSYIEFDFNMTPSLPYHFLVVMKWLPPERDQLIAFYYKKNPFYPVEQLVAKRLLGLAGDKIGNHSGWFYVNERAVGYAKFTVTPSKKLGRTLNPGPTGEIPVGQYYVSGDHPDSFDSRYADVGWIKSNQVVGRAYALF